MPWECKYIRLKVMAHDEVYFYECKSKFDVVASTTGEADYARHLVYFAYVLLFKTLLLENFVVLLVCPLVLIFFLH